MYRNDLHWPYTHHTWYRWNSNSTIAVCFLYKTVGTFTDTTAEIFVLNEKGMCNAVTAH